MSLSVDHLSIRKGSQTLHLRSLPKPKRAFLGLLGWNSYGKEGVDGSSPSEGSGKCLLVSSFCWPDWRRFWASTSTERPPLAAIASCEAWNPSQLEALQASVATSTQRPRPVRSPARRGARRRVRGCRERDGHSGGRSSRCST